MFRMGNEGLEIRPRRKERGASSVVIAPCPECASSTSSQLAASVVGGAAFASRHRDPARTRRGAAASGAPQPWLTRLTLPLSQTTRASACCSGACALPLASQQRLRASSGGGDGCQGASRPPCTQPRARQERWAHAASGAACVHAHDGPQVQGVACQGDHSRGAQVTVDGRGVPRRQHVVVGERDCRRGQAEAQRCGGAAGGCCAKQESKAAQEEEACDASPHGVLPLCCAHAAEGWSRYKYAVQVFVGEQRGEGVRCVLAGLLA